MIKFIHTEDVLSLRNSVLREGKFLLKDCIFENDDHPKTFHLGYYHDDELVCVASFHPQKHPDFTGNAYQLRGMATAHNFQGKGIGNKLVNFAIVYLRGQQINYVWCNARQKAFKFYTSLGFEFISDFFDIPNIGPHKQMYLKIR
jgi:predicted GNAT family N-acyltransferase